jgi:hypothetical protein
MYPIASRSSKLKSIIGATEGSDRILQNQQNRAWKSGVTKLHTKNYPKYQGEINFERERVRRDLRQIRLNYSSRYFILVSPVIEEIKRRRESNFSLTLLRICFRSSFHEMNGPKKQPFNAVIN